MQHTAEKKETETLSIRDIMTRIQKKGETTNTTGGKGRKEQNAMQDALPV